MAKNIKFNLLVGDKKLTTLEALQENFYLDEVLDHYHSGFLAKWLLSSGFQHEYEQVSALDAKDNVSLSLELAKIFNISCHQEDLKGIVPKLHCKLPLPTFHQLLDDICKINHFTNIEKTKELVELLVKKYYDEYEANKMPIFVRFVKGAPFAALAIINNPKAFKPFLKTIMRYNHVYKTQEVSPADIEELRKFSSLIESLAHSKQYSFIDLERHFSNITMYSMASTPGKIAQWSMEHPVRLFRQLILLPFDGYVFNDGIDFTDIFSQFAITAINDFCDVKFEFSDQIFLTVDLMHYGIVATHWADIADRWDEAFNNRY